MKIYISSQRV